MSAGGRGASSQEGVSIEGEAQYSEQFIDEPSAETKHALLAGFKKFGQSFEDAAKAFQNLNDLKTFERSEVNREEGITFLKDFGNEIVEEEAQEICDAIGLVHSTD